MNLRFFGILCGTVLVLCGIAVVALTASFAVPAMPKIELIESPPCRVTYYEVLTLDGSRWNCEKVVGVSNKDLHNCTNPNSIIAEKDQDKKTFIGANGVSVTEVERDCRR